MFGQSFLALCLVAIILCTVNADEINELKKGASRIVNGHVITIRQAPYIVQLRINGGGNFCGGTLVHPQFVVSAAHCFDKIPYESMVVVGAANTRSDSGEQRRITRMIRYPGWTRDNMNNDVAILMLESPIYAVNAQPVPLCSRPVNAGDQAQISGWGHTSSGGAGSEFLRSIFLPIIAQDQCKAYHKYTGIPLTEQMICAHNEYQQDSCQGDSGGPLIVHGELCGIVSWGIGCASGLPGVYTNVYNLRDYINSAIASMSRM